MDITDKTNPSEVERERIARRAVDLLFHSGMFSREERLIFGMKYAPGPLIEELTIPEIGEVLKMMHSEVQQRYDSAIQKLRQYL